MKTPVEKETQVLTDMILNEDQLKSIQYRIRHAKNIHEHCWSHNQVQCLMNTIWSLKGGEPENF